MPQARAILRRTLADARIRDVTFALFLLLFAFVNPIGYRHSYPTLADRVAFARGFGTNKAVELFYGVPHELLTTGGFTAWRFGGFAVVITAIWGVVAAVRGLRGEEDAGRQELVLAGAVRRRTAYLAVVGALGVAIVLLWLAMFAGLAAGRLPVGGSAYLALATIAPAVVFAGVGALASQLAASRRVALGLAFTALALTFLLRVIADTTGGLGWLRWATPLGWSEELRPFAGPRPAVLLLPALAAALLVLAAGVIAARRDVGTGILHGHDSAEPELRLLSSPTALALRAGRGTLAAWTVGIGLFALVIGILSTSFTSGDISNNLQRQLHKLNGAAITTPAGAIGFYFLFFVLTISLFACTRVAAIRREEADLQLETLFALPVGRRRWLWYRLLLGAGEAAMLALTAAVLAWAGAASQDAGISLSRLLEAGGNCLPPALLFLTLAALAFAILPRASGGIGYGLVTVAFVWELFGALLGAPHWLVQATPFAHIGLVPAEPFRVEAAAIMLGLAVASGLAAVSVFAHRDLVGP
ncbi:MAG: polyketide antibiotic transporter [Gaiellaceae bacterium]